MDDKKFFYYIFGAPMFHFLPQLIMLPGANYHPGNPRYGFQYK